MTTSTSYSGDPRRAILVNGAAYQRARHKRPEPDITIWQSLIAGVVVAAFALGVLAIAVGVS